MDKELHSKAKMEDDTLQGVAGGMDGAGENWGDVSDSSVFMCLKCRQPFARLVKPAVCPTEGCGGTWFIQLS